MLNVISRKEGEGATTLFFPGPSLIKFKQHSNTTNLPKDLYSSNWTSVGYSYDKVYGRVSDFDSFFVRSPDKLEKIAKEVPEDRIITPVDLRKGDASYKVFTSSPKDPEYSDFEACHESASIFGVNSVQMAIHVMAYMGYTKIYVLGLDYKPHSNNKSHFHTGIDPAYGKLRHVDMESQKIEDKKFIYKIENFYHIQVKNLSKYLS